MQIISNHVAGGNFGDQLNDVIWSSLLPNLSRIWPKHAIAGIGTFGHLTVPRHVEYLHVFGTGATGDLSASFPNVKNLKVHFLRGPLTAKIWGAPGLGLVDGAALITQTKLWELPAETRTHRIGYVPHHLSDKFANYELICRLAGVKYVTSRGYDTESFIRKIKSCDYIITEALHGAVVADLFRKPWVAVSSRRYINAFKWDDWCRSIGLEYHPNSIDFVCTRGITPCERLIKIGKRVLFEHGLGKYKWRFKKVRYDSRAAEDLVAEQIIGVRREARFILSSEAVSQRVLAQATAAWNSFAKLIANCD